MEALQTLSARGLSNVAVIMPKIAGAVEERSRLTTTGAPIDLATAENWLMRAELIELCCETLTQELCAKDYSYPAAFGGHPDTLDALAAFFNAHFNPRIAVEVQHLAIAPGAAGCIDGLLYNICNPGDGVLVPSLYWSGFDLQFKVRASVVPIIVPVKDISSMLSESMVPALEKAYQESLCPIKALIVTNPHNPLGRCYTRGCIEECIRFCHSKGIHYISDEVYAMTSYDCPEIPDPVPFISALSIDVDNLGCDLNKVHTFWSISKDLGSSGLRLGCTVTQSNKAMQVGLALSAIPQTSQLASVFVTALLSPAKLSPLLALNSSRLSRAYEKITSCLKRNQVPYLPSYAGLYVFAKVNRHAETWEDEAETVQKIKDAGVMISPGRSYHPPESEKGWARITFAVADDQLDEAIRRLNTVLGGTNNSAQPNTSLLTEEEMPAKHHA